MSSSKHFLMPMAWCLFALTIMTVRADAAPIKISDFADLCKIGQNEDYPLDGVYELTANIDASASRTMNDGAGFEPIGKRVVVVDAVDSGAAFTGAFDGKGFKISELYIKRAGADDAGANIGLFGYALDARIKNVAVITDSVIGYRYVGALVGRSTGSTIEKCYTSGTVIGDDAGGLIGLIEGESAVTACYSSAAVSGTLALGGLVGSNSGSGISWCYSYGTVNVIDEAGTWAGGLVGRNSLNLASGIANCYSIAAVTGASDVGGLVGENYNGGMISRSYSAGAVSGSGSNVGGFVGVNDKSQILHCYLDTARSGRSEVLTGVTAKSSAEMTRSGTFAGWIFSADAGWGISNNYPYIKDLPFHTMTFKAATGGTVAGGSAHVQRVNPGFDGINVTAALLEYGEAFDGWYLVSAAGDAVGDDDDVIDIADGTDEKLVPGKYSGFAVSKISDDSLTIALSELTGDVEIEARFTLKSYDLTYIARAGGKIYYNDPNSNIDTVTIADTLTFTVQYGSAGPLVMAIPAVGFNFGRWSDRDTSAMRAADTVWGDTTFFAIFSTGIITLTYSGGPDGRVRFGSLGPMQQTISETVNFGANGRSVEASPNADKLEDYEFVMWSDSVTENPRTAVNVRVNTDVVAIFAIKKAAYTYVARPGGKVTLKDDIPVVDTLYVGVDTLVTRVDYYARGPEVAALPDPGYLFVKWSDNITANVRTDSTGWKDITVSAIFEEDSTIAVKFNDRVIPKNGTDNASAAIINPVTITAGEFSAGPNPVSRALDAVKFYWTGRGVNNGKLSVYDANGNFVRKINVNDDKLLKIERRQIASWDLTDRKGKPVANGMYLVKGTLMMRDGKKETVSLIIGVR